MRAGILLLLALGIASPENAVVKLEKNVKKGWYEIDKNKLKIFCYGGEKSWNRIWSSLDFIVDSKAEEFTLNIADNASVLLDRFNSDWWSSLLSTPTYQKKITVSPYGISCIGLSYHGSTTKFSVTLKETVINWRFPFLLLMGITLLLSSHHMSRSVSFHYTSGVAIGITASLLILVYLVSRIIPGKPVAYSVMLGGWALVAWAFSEVQSNLYHLITSYPHYIIIYTTLVGVASFLFCYWKGPPTHPRTFQIIQWLIQLVGMILVYNATQLRETSLILLAVTVLLYLIRTKTVQCIEKFYWQHVLLRWYVMFPPKHKLLTSKEYKEEGVRETAAALQQLRDFCRQNTGETYRIMARLQSPNRFSKFLDGDFHLTDSEVKEYHHWSPHESDNDEM